MIDPAEAFDALLTELRRQKATGVRLVSVSSESLQALRSLAGTAAPASAPVAPVARPVAAPAPAAIRREVPPPVAPAAVPRPVVRPAVKTPAPALVIPEPPVFSLPAGAKAERMRALIELIQACPETRRHLEPGQKPVVGHGSLEARILFVGEAPTPEEAESGRPFVGDAGEMLRKILAAAGLREQDVFLAPLMTWRPEPPTAFGKRPPTVRELAFNLPYLRAQVEIVRPEVIVALGAQALEALLPPAPNKAAAPKVTALRGHWQEFAGIPMMPTFHPNYLLHSPSLSNKRAAWEDLLQVMEKLGLPISDKQRGYFLSAPKAADSAD